jgi:hypothetical protein
MKYRAQRGQTLARQCSFISANRASLGTARKEHGRHLPGGTKRHVWHVWLSSALPASLPGCYLSRHPWLEERGPRGCLMNMVDDASGDTLVRMGSEKAIWAAAGALRAWVKKYGVSVALYTDWKNVYVREASTKEQLQGVVPVTQFGQMCQRLGIRIIAANSAQAKGRVERNHGTHQDRLVKKMRLKKIKTMRRRTCFWRRNICRNTIGGFGETRRSSRTIIERPREPWSWRTFFIWKPCELSATTGWCGTTTATSR